MIIKYVIILSSKVDPTTGYERTNFFFTLVNHVLWLGPILSHEKLMSASVLSLFQLYKNILVQNCVRLKKEIFSYKYCDFVDF